MQMPIGLRTLVPGTKGRRQSCYKDPGRSWRELGGGGDLQPGGYVPEMPVGGGGCLAHVDETLPVARSWAGALRRVLRFDKRVL